MRHFLRVVLLMLLASAVAMAGKDRLAEKRADRQRQAETSSIFSLARTAAMWDTLNFYAAPYEVDMIFQLPGGVIWASGYDDILADDYAWRSTDNGATWQQIPLLFTKTAGAALAPRDANLAIAATALGDIYRTTDGGATWDSVYTYGGGSGYFDGAVFIGKDSVMAVGDADASGLCVVKSTDAGATWTRFTNLPTAEQATDVISSSSIHQMMDAIGPKVWITTYVGTGTAPRLLRTSDFGETWTSADLLLTGGLSNAYYIRSINMVDENVGWIVPRQTATGVRCFVHKTTDGGATWSDTILVERGNVVFAVKPQRGSNNLLAVGYIGNNPRAWWSTNGGGTWGSVYSEDPEDGSDFRNASFVSPQLAYVVGLYKAMSFIPPGSTDVPVQTSGVPESYKLGQNYPNPFNPSTTIEYAIPTAGSVQLRVYDMLGREVATLVDQEQGAGTYTVRFDARSLASGIYYYTLKSGTFAGAKSLVLVK